MSAETEELRDLQYIIETVYERSRVRLHDGKEALIKARLGKRMRALGIPTLHGYCDFLRQPGHDDEFTHLIDALTTNFTNFLREKDHFEFLVKTALPSLLKGKKRFCVWSSACATGEEPYTMAFYLAESFPLNAGWEWSILATDLSTKALAKAREGIYAVERLESVPADWMRKYLQRGHGEWEGHYRIKPAISERIHFRQVNLIGAMNFQQPFEVIFCRNVMIYFDRPTQAQVVRTLSQALVPGGYLLIGHSESINGLQVPFRCVRPSVYQKI